MTQAERVDVVVFGGGVAGLWTRSVLSGRGYSVVLIDNAPLGTGQTLASQGIIHAGLKYSLLGKASRASQMTADASARFCEALRGEGEIDLSGLTVLTDKMINWTLDGRSSRGAAKAASMVMRSGVRKLAAAEYPEAFSSAPESIDVYEVDEPTIDPAELLVQLVRAGSGPLLRAASESTPSIETIDHEVCVEVSLESGRMQSFCARRVLLCAGVGNEALLRAIQVKPSIAQRRPLHMVVVRDAPFELYGHCLQLSDKPFLTVTTDRTDDGLVWIVGGELAEQGVERTCYEQTAAAKVALAKALPWIELEQCEFDTFRVDRAEGRTRDGKRPDEPVVAEFGQVIAAWPTKLVLAPLLVDRIVEIFERDGVQPAETDLSNETCETDLGNKPWHRGDKL